MKNFKMISFTLATGALMLFGLHGSKAPVSAITTLEGNDTDSMQLRSLIVEGFEKAEWQGTARPGGVQGQVETKLVDNCVPASQAFNEASKTALPLNQNRQELLTSVVMVKLIVRC